METICTRLKTEAIEHKSLGMVDADYELLAGYESSIIASEKKDISISELFSHMMKLRSAGNVAYECKSAAREVQLQLITLMNTYIKTMEAAYSTSVR